MPSQDSHTARTADPLIGRVVSDRYRVVRKLGEGGVGGVYFAEHLLINRKVALKVLLPDMARPQMVESFLEEARTVARIGHENVIDIFYGGRSPEGFVFLAMEYLEGVDLAQVLKDGPIPWERARPILTQIAAALGAVHQHGIVHRDIKPENVFLIDRPNHPDFVKLLDFGVAKVLAAGEVDTGQGLISGTPEYMAPEQAQAGRIDHRADIYSLGCVMYHMVTGAPPFSAPSILHLLSKHLHEAPTAPSVRRPDLAISAEIDAVVMRALQKNPDDRWQNMAAFADAIDHARQTRRTTSHSDGTPKGVLRVDDSAIYAHRRRKGRVLGAVGLVAAIVGAGVGYKVFTTAPGHVHISTVPADATVVFNDVTVAARSPMVLDAPPGSYTVAVSRPGYVAVRHQIDVTARSTLSVPVTLEPSADTGLEITSDPPGLPIYLDGAPLRIGGSADAGQVHTNFLATALPVGRHALEIGDPSRAHPWRQEVEVVAGTIQKVHAQLDSKGAALLAKTPAAIPAPPASRHQGF